MALRYFFDLPVYRLSAEQYYAGRDAYIERIIFRTGTPEEPHLRQREMASPRSNDALRNHLTEKYGGCWQFNEIIGYIKLDFLGSQIRGEYFAVDRKRIVRTRTKTFEYKTWKLAPEIDIEQPYGTGEVLGAMQRDTFKPARRNCRSGSLIHLTSTSWRRTSIGGLCTYGTI